MWEPGAVPEPPQRPAPAIAKVLEEIDPRPLLARLDELAQRRDEE